MRTTLVPIQHHTHRRRGRSPLAAVLPALLLPLLAACASSAPSVTQRTPTPPAAAHPTATVPVTPSATAVPHYTRVVLAHGDGNPDDLTLDEQGRVVFTDSGSGEVFRVEADGRVTRLANGLAAPEGVIALPDGSLLVAVQGKPGNVTDKIVRLVPGGGATSVFASFTNATGSVGLDSIWRDPRTGEVLAADSPNGKVYRISADGSRATLLASGFTRPVDAIADAAGNVYVADEYGNRVAVISPSGTVRDLAHLSLPDDLAFDTDGTLLVTLLGNNTLLRLDPEGGHVLATLAADLHEPQGLAVDANGDLYISEETANLLIELRRS